MIMSHVLVPCPEEYVTELTAGLMRLAMGASGWDDGSIASFVSGLDEPEKQLVQAVATAAVNEDRVRYRSVATLLGVDVGAILDLVTDVNDRCRRQGFPMPLITDTRLIPGDEGVQVPTPVLAIVRPVAERILAYSSSRDAASTTNL